MKGKLWLSVTVISTLLASVLVGIRNAEVKVVKVPEPMSRLRVQGGVLRDEKGKPIGLFGVNLFETHLSWAVTQNVAEMERELRVIASLGFNAIRVPMNMAYIEPEPDVFPDSTRYEEVMKRHRLKPNSPQFLDALVRTASEL